MHTITICSIFTPMSPNYRALSWKPITYNSIWVLCSIHHPFCTMSRINSCRIISPSSRNITPSWFCCWLCRLIII
nr:MAG TPA: hypothetical protein [Bacteriophage sp.]